ncbi:hypothetical protein GO986_17840 [Deinococcus sp. HMF7620]|uniref:Uncharacterized protein n=1 Tax=Deinococcus arboris TaxID=2682977 RepID=A0A7C9LSZ5_9DEIO|nr:hypothetical protein [Deinococcus arboris]MVN88601.1 hypothetical protein [Deinococcus arboris]
MMPAPSRQHAPWLALLGTLYLLAVLADVLLVPDGDPDWAWINYALNVVKLGSVFALVYLSYRRRWLLIGLVVVGLAISLLTLPRPYSP